MLMPSLAFRLMTVADVSELFGDGRMIAFLFDDRLTQFPILRHAEVILFFGLYQGGSRYDLHFELLTESVSADRATRDAELRHWVGRYAARLEHHARCSPFNWFNFYDFWQDTPAAR